MSTRSASLMSILKRIENARGDEQITIGEIVNLIGQVSFAPLLIVPAIALVTPLSGIPLFSATMGIIIFLVSSQMVLRREYLWLPQWVLRIRANRRYVKTAFEKMHPLVKWLDRRTETRLTVLTHKPLVFVPQLLCVLSGLVLPLMEFIPFSSSMVGLSVALLGIGILARDGAVVFLALVPYALVGGLVWKVVGA
ncbi:exopolysaccharide biosynthesis protein [uncultured Sulfitobacter sp.]|uniref:exopolysaccharide biosynthesis protein n=1 Tax=uncultured Sulfitobacter sp. TaxID=191468 RepID=UPI00263895E6|nr:exopolysaccharide biosynthesis protein [uncultured Sulfitobacter sp.]